MLQFHWCETTKWLFFFLLRSFGQQNNAQEKYHWNTKMFTFLLLASTKKKYNNSIEALEKRIRCLQIDQMHMSDIGWLSQSKLIGISFVKWNFVWLFTKSIVFVYLRQWVCLCLYEAFPHAERLWVLNRKCLRSPWFMATINYLTFCCRLIISWTLWKHTLHQYWFICSVFFLAINSLNSMFIICYLCEPSDEYFFFFFGLCLFYCLLPIKRVYFVFIQPCKYRVSVGESFHSVSIFFVYFTLLLSIDSIIEISFVVTFNRLFDQFVRLCVVCVHVCITRRKSLTSINYSILVCLTLSVKFSFIIIMYNIYYCDK